MEIESYPPQNLAFVRGTFSAAQRRHPLASRCLLLLDEWFSGYLFHCPSLLAGAVISQRLYIIIII
jgi:hypothetical protein